MPLRSAYGCRDDEGGGGAGEQGTTICDRSNHLRGRPRREEDERKKEKEGGWMRACVRVPCVEGGKEGEGGTDGRTDGKKETWFARSLATQRRG